MKVQTGRSKIISIQILRAVACLLVLQIHIFKTIPTTTIVLNGAVGVDIFFIISGYIIAASVDNIHGVNPMRSFLVNRFSRVIPYYYLITIICALTILLVKNSLDIHQLIKSFLFIPQGNDPTLILGWSLNHEVFFYLFVGICLLGTTNLRVIAGSFFIFLVAVNLLPGNRYFLNFLRASINVTFLIGFLIYIYRATLLPLFTSKWLILISAASVIVVMLISNEVPLTPQHILLIPKTGYYSRDVVFINNLSCSVRRIFIYGIPSAFLFITVVANEAFFRQLRNRWIVKIGDASYSLYLIQTPFIIVIWNHARLNFLILSVIFVVIIFMSFAMLKVENAIGNYFKGKFTKVFQL